jgi:hypothetical protein
MRIVFEDRDDAGVVVDEQRRRLVVSIGPGTSTADVARALRAAGVEAEVVDTSAGAEFNEPSPDLQVSGARRPNRAERRAEARRRRRARARG